MESGLAAAHPEIRTYAGRSKDGLGPRLDVTPMGFHAFVRGLRGGTPGSSTPPTTATTASTSPTWATTCRARARPRRAGAARRRGPGRGRRRPGRRGEPGRRGQAAHLPAGPDRPATRATSVELNLRHRQRAGREGHADQPGQRGLQRRPRHPAGADQRHHQAEPRHRGEGHRHQRPVRRGGLLHRRAAGQLRRRQPERQPDRASASSSAPTTTTSATSALASTAAASPLGVSARNNKAEAAPGFPTPGGRLLRRRLRGSRDGPPVRR